MIHRIILYFGIRSRYNFIYNWPENYLKFIRFDYLRGKQLSDSGREKSAQTGYIIWKLNKWCFTVVGDSGLPIKSIMNFWSVRFVLFRILCVVLVVTWTVLYATTAIHILFVCIQYSMCVSVCVCLVFSQHVVVLFFVSQNVVQHIGFLRDDECAQTCSRFRIVAILAVVFIISVVVYDVDYIRSHYGFVLYINVLKICWLSYRISPFGVITLIVMC